MIDRITNKFSTPIFSITNTFGNLLKLISFLALPIIAKAQKSEPTNSYNGNPLYSPAGVGTVIGATVIFTLFGSAIAVCAYWNFRKNYLKELAIKQGLNQIDGAVRPIPEIKLP